MQNNGLVATVLVASVLWAGISWYWYVCGIKGFCGSEPEVVDVTPVSERETETVIEDRPTQTITRTETRTEELTIRCDSYLNSYIRLGYNNNASEVRKLESFLNTYEGEDLTVDGSFTQADESAVKRFQEKYRAQVMDPWGMTSPSGYVFKTTRDHINALKCAYDYAESEGAEVEVIKG